MFRTQSTEGKPTGWYRLLGLLIAFLLVGSALLAFTSVRQAHAATNNVAQSAVPLTVSGGNIGAMATGQIGGTCGQYYGCPYPGQWCAEFAKWLWSYGGENVSGLTAGAGSFYVYGQNHHTLSNTPAVGDAVVFGYNGAGYAQHVAIVVSVNTTNHTIYSVGGNERGGAGVVAKDGPYNWTVGYSSYWNMNISGYVAPVGGGTTCPGQIQSGSTGAAVKVLQSDLNYDYSHHVFGNTPYNFSPPLAVDGQFGPLTKNAVMDFQKAKGITVDGQVGPQTWHALGAC